MPGRTEEEHSKPQLIVGSQAEFLEYRPLTHDILHADAEFRKNRSHGLTRLGFLLKEGRWARSNKDTFLYLVNGYISDCIIIILQLHKSIQH
jgi:hypothetical protein